MSAPADPWTLVMQAAVLLAVDPVGLGGAALRGPASPARDAWLAAFRAALPPKTPWRKMPPQVAEGRLLGGLDLAATLAAGRPIAERGLLAEASGGVVVVPMAERLGGPAVGHLGAALDAGEIVVERDGIAARMAARVTVVLLDEGIEDERAPAALGERLAFMVEAESCKTAAVEAAAAAEIPAARTRLLTVTVDDDVVEALAGAGLAFGVPSLRVATLALRAAKAAAALAGRDAVAAEDAELAAALVFAPRAIRLPAAEAEPEEAESEPDSPHDPDTQLADVEAQPGDAQPIADSVVEATRAAIPADLLAALSGAAMAPRQAAGGRSGVARASAKRGRPAGVRRGAPGHGVRLAVVETLRAAAPWQPLRRRQAAQNNIAPSGILVRREDFRVGRFKEKTESLTIFVVDASGSAALHRLAEVKGAVELILADCYVRRDSVALIAFRGERAELILPPTRSLTRAKRALAGQAGGGGTPLAAAIDAATLLAQATLRKGQAPLVVLLTDGKANIARNGRPGRAEAEADALAAARAFRFGAAPGLVLDIAPRPGEVAGRLAQAMGARYIPLPYADARLLSRAVLAAGPAA